MSCFIFMSHESPPQQQQHPSFAAWSLASCFFMSQESPLQQSGIIAQHDSVSFF
jgi:hypothetical protein